MEDSFNPEGRRPDIELNLIIPLQYARDDYHFYRKIGFCRVLFRRQLRYGAQGLVALVPRAVCAQLLALRQDNKPLRVAVLLTHGKHARAPVLFIHARFVGERKFIF